MPERQLRVSVGPKVLASGITLSGSQGDWGSYWMFYTLQRIVWVRYRRRQYYVGQFYLPSWSQSYTSIFTVLKCRR